LAIEDGYLTEEQLNELLNAQKKSNILLGQVLIEKGIFTFEKYEEVLLQYRQDSSLTADEIHALKNNDVAKITEIFLKSLSGDHNKMIHHYFELFIKNIVRFIDDEIRVEEAQEADSYSFDYLVTQGIKGEHSFFSGFAAAETVLSRVASIYAEEELETMNDLAKDALGEFLNCQNGLFLSHLSHQGIEMELLPSQVHKDGVLKPVAKLYVIPCHLSFGKIDFLFADEHPELAEQDAQ
jgi:CheY-specific phosphatase CheX